MDKKAPRLDINPNKFLLNERPHLVEAAEWGVSDVMQLQGYMPNTRVDANEDTAQAITGFEFSLQVEHGSEQIDARYFLQMLEEKWHQFGMPKHRMLALTDRELITDEQGFVAGATSPNLQFSVLSLADVIKSDASYGTQSRVTRHLVRRQYGMMEGLPYDNETPGENSGLKIYHNEDLCTSKFTHDLPETVQLAEQLFGSSTAGFCVGCASKLRKNRVA